MDTPPPGLDEAIAISKVRIIFLLILLLVLCIVYPKMSTDHVTFFQVIQFLESQEYSMFTRIVFDTAPTVSKSLLFHVILSCKLVY